MIYFITTLSLIIVAYVSLYSIYKIRKRVCNQPYFIVVPSYMYIYNEDDIGRESSDITDDPVLRKAMGLDRKYKEEEINKKVTIRVKIDLSKVFCYFEWTSSRFHDDKVLSDTTLLKLFDGDEIIVALPYDQFDNLFEEYETEQRNIG